MNALIDDLRRTVGTTGVITATEELAPYLADVRGLYHGDALCAVRPRSTDEVAAVVGHCIARGVPVLAQGGNTSLSGGAVPFAGERGVVVSLARMRRIRHVDAASNSITVDAGCVLAEVQRAAAQMGRLYPVSLGAEGSCQIGGNIATNAGGTNVLRYGNTRDNVLGLEVVLPDARVWNGLRALRKDNTGFDLKQLFIGSEGLLGIVTGATLKLHPLPTHHVAAWVAPVSIDASLELLARFQTTLGTRMSAFEIMNGAQLGNVLALGPEYKSPINPAAPWHVLVDLGEAFDDPQLRSSAENVLYDALSGGLLSDVAVAISEAQRAAMWKIRHSVVEANNRAGKRVLLDVAVPISQVPDFVQRASQMLEERFAGIQVVVVGHFGDGNLHFSPLFSFEQWNALPDTAAVVAEIRRIVHDLTAELNGTFSAEHGVGQDLLLEMLRYKSSVELDLMRRVKHALDPQGLFNPGKMIPSPPA